MSAERADVLIVGGGIAGLATAWHLARLPEAPRVTLLERADLLGSESSGRNAAILRTFGPDPVLRALGRRSAAFLAAPPAGFAPQALVDPVGLLLGASGSAAEGLAAAAQEEPRARRVDPGTVGRLAPHVRADAQLWLHFPDEGRLDVAAELEAFARGARAAGAELRTGCAVERLLVAGGAVEGVALADGRELRAARTVLAAGAWATRLARPAGSRVRLRPTRRHLVVTALDARVDPRWPVVWIEDGPFYCRPESGGLLVSACDLTDVDPDRCVRDPAVLEEVARRMARHAPRFAGAGVAHYWCGLRTLTADDRFAIGDDPDLAGLFWVAGLGGHGMTAGPEAGRLAALALTGRLEEADGALLRALAPERLAAAPQASPAPL